MVLNAKMRRHSGRVFPSCYGARKEILIEEGIEPQAHWDDWKDFRDGFRGCDDRKMIRNRYMFGASYFNVKRWNDKLQRLLSRRKAKKLKKKLMENFNY